MAAPGSNSESTHDLPEGFCEALAFYDAQVQGAGQHQSARQATLDKYPDWADRLRQNFEVEDRLLGATPATPQPGDFGSLPFEFDPAALSDSGSRLVPRYRLGVGGERRGLAGT